MSAGQETAGPIAFPSPIRGARDHMSICQQRRHTASAPNMRNASCSQRWHGSATEERLELVGVSFPVGDPALIVIVVRFDVLDFSW